MRLTLIIAVLMTLSGWCWSQGDTVHYVKIGGVSEETAVALFEASDSTFWICANSGQSGLESGSAIHVLEVSESGTVLLSRGYGTYATDRAESADFDSSLLVIAGVSNGNAGRYQGMLLFIDPLTGELIKEVYRDLDQSWSQYAMVRILGDTVVAFLETIDSSSTTVALERFDRSGNLISSSTPSYLNGVHLKRLEPSAHFSNTYLAVGYRHLEDRDALLMKLNNQLDTIWTVTLNLVGNDAFEDVTEFSDSSVIAVGYAEGFFLEDEDIVIMRFDSSGAALDTAIQGYGATSNNRDDRAHAVTAVNDTLFIVGFTRTYGEGGKEVFFSRLDKTLFEAGTSTTFGTLKDEDSHDFLIRDGSIFGIGYSEFQAAGTRDILFWRRDSLETSFIIKSIRTKNYSLQESILNTDHLAKEQSAITVTSNPDQVSFRCELGSGCSFIIVDMNGRLLLQEEVGYQENFQSPLPTGMYILKSTDSNQPFAIKIPVHP